MSKRLNPDTNCNDSKKQKLDRSLFSSSCQEDDDVWGDDDILLLASQAYEDIEINDKICVNKASTSCSKVENEKEFQKYWKDDKNNFAKPLPTEEYIGSASNGYIQSLLKQIKSLKVENDKLKTDHESLTIKCLDGQGESSILRSKLKTASGQLESFRLEIVKEKKKEHLEWSKSLDEANKEIQNFRTQLDFKKLEVENLKEKCKFFESGRIKTVEIPTPTKELKWPNFSQTLNSSFTKPDPRLKPSLPVKESFVQTSRSKYTRLRLRHDDQLVFNSIPESIFNASKIDQSSFLDNPIFEKTSVKPLSSKKVENRLSRTHHSNKVNSKSNLKVLFQDFYEDIAVIIKLKIKDLNVDCHVDRCLKIVLMTKELLLNALEDLQSLEKRNSAKLLKISDEKYFELSSDTTPYENRILFSEKPCCENEMAIDARRLMAVLSKLCKYSSHSAKAVLGIKTTRSEILYKEISKELIYIKKFETEYPTMDGFIKLFTHICQKINLTGCSYVYTGLLTVVTMTLKNTLRCERDKINQYAQPVFALMKEIIYLRPHVTVLSQIVKIFGEFSQSKVFLQCLCTYYDKSLKFDCSQGVALYNNETCFIHILTNQIEVVLHQSNDLKCLKNVFVTTHAFLEILYYGNKYLLPWSHFNNEVSCQSNLKIHQCVLYCLWKCARLYKNFFPFFKDTKCVSFYNSVLKSGLIILSHCTLDDIDFIPRLGNYEGYFQWFLSDVQSISDHLQLLDIHKDALSDLTAKILSLIEEDSTDNQNTWIWDEHFSSLTMQD